MFTKVKLLGLGLGIILMLPLTLRAEDKAPTEDAVRFKSFEEFLMSKNNVIKLTDEQAKAVVESYNAYKKAARQQREDFRRDNRQDQDRPQRADKASNKDKPQAESSGQRRHMDGKDNDDGDCKFAGRGNPSSMDEIKGKMRFLKQYIFKCIDEYMQNGKTACARDNDNDRSPRQRMLDKPGRNFCQADSRDGRMMPPAMRMRCGNNRPDFDRDDFPRHDRRMMRNFRDRDDSDDSSDRNVKESRDVRGDRGFKCDDCAKRDNFRRDAPRHRRHFQPRQSERDDD